MNEGATRWTNSSVIFFTSATEGLKRALRNLLNIVLNNCNSRFC